MALLCAHNVCWNETFSAELVIFTDKALPLGVLIVALDADGGIVVVILADSFWFCLLLSHEHREGIENLLAKLLCWLTDRLVVFKSNFIRPPVFLHNCSGPLSRSKLLFAEYIVECLLLFLECLLLFLILLFHVLFCHLVLLVLVFLIRYIQSPPSSDYPYSSIASRFLIFLWKDPIFLNKLSPLSSEFLDSLSSDEAAPCFLYIPCHNNLSHRANLIADASLDRTEKF